MNIGEAKQEIINTIRAYRQKDDMGGYLIPVQKQRPILLIGPPGIGKTAIMEQVAEELSINLVSYTITHHTRQSAIGLPFISKKKYGNKEMSVTEYTMSEIIASVYDKIAQTGIHEGILFLDEINCVSETLMPTMLQFLQYKTFGAHKVPDGFIIVTAGNPPEYNKAVRDFDIVTLDRVKKIEIEEDLDTFKEYADKTGIHGAVLAYLDIHKDNFYRIKNDINGKQFVTARGWEDLSQLIRTYEKLGIEVDEKVTRQYLQEPEIARDFAMFYALYKKYEAAYNISEIMEGKAEVDRDKLRKAPFDEKLSILSLFMDKLTQEFVQYNRDLSLQLRLRDEITNIVKKSEEGSLSDLLRDRQEVLIREYESKAGEHLMDHEQEIVLKKVIDASREFEELAIGKKGDDVKALLKEWFTGREIGRREAAEKTSAHLNNCFDFIAKVYGEEQEMVLFLTRLDSGHYSLSFIQNEGCEKYYEYNKLLLLRDKKQELREKVLSIL